MSSYALALVLLSALAHASWNLLAKRVSGGPGFTWLFDMLSVLLCAPPAIAAAVALRPVIGPVELGLMLGSALLHMGYFLLLGQGYRVGELSVVYPLARGLGPVLSTAAAIAFLGERPGPLALAGAALIGVGVFALAGDPRRLRRSGAGRSVTYAALTGLCIAAYTIWDKHAVSAGGGQMAPLIYFFGFTALRAALMTPLGLARWAEVRESWRSHRREALGIAVLSPLSYILVLTALVVSPVSYVAPAREIGILLGAAMGARFLAEGDASRRLAAASAMVLGVVGLALG